MHTCIRQGMVQYYAICHSKQLPTRLEMRLSVGFSMNSQKMMALMHYQVQLRFT